MTPEKRSIPKFRHAERPVRGNARAAAAVLLRGRSGRRDAGAPTSAPRDARPGIPPGRSKIRCRNVPSEVRGPGGRRDQPTGQACGKGRANLSGSRGTPHPAPVPAGGAPCCGESRYRCWKRRRTTTVRAPAGTPAPARRVRPSIGRINGPRRAGIPRRPWTPEPCITRMRSVSTTSSCVWPSAITAAPASSAAPRRRLCRTSRATSSRLRPVACARLAHSPGGTAFTMSLIPRSEHRRLAKAISAAVSSDGRIP